MDLDTNSDLFPEGTYRFRVADVPEEGETKGGYPFFKFTFACDETDQVYQERFMRWMMAPICRALGFQEFKPGVFHFELTQCLDREVEATIRHEKIEKGPSAGQVVARMKEIKPGGSNTAPAPRAALAAQAPLDSEIPF